MNPGLRAGTLELISPRSSLKRVADTDESSAISYEQRAADHSALEIYQELQFAELLRSERRLLFPTKISQDSPLLPSTL